MTDPAREGGIEITIPIVPPATLLPNARRRGKGGSSFWQQAKDTDMLRGAAGVACIGIDPIPTPVRVTYHVEWPPDRYKGKSRMPDTDALPTACKAILDGLVDREVIPDDSPEHVVFVGASQTKETRAGVVIVRVEPA
jgi:Holliday junction resolvase RusA-like endonuclease